MTKPASLIVTLPSSYSHSFTPTLFSSRSAQQNSSCWIKDSIVVCEFGDHNVTSNCKQYAFCPVLLNEIKLGINEGEQLLGKVTMRLAGFCHDLNEVSDSVTDKLFKRVENTVLSHFTTFVLQYNGPIVVYDDFVEKMKAFV